MSHSDKIVLVTGANKGIGFEAVRLLATEHPTWTVLMGARSQANADAALAKLPEEARKNTKVVLIDVSDDKSVVAAAEQVKSQFGRLDVLINNAGIAIASDYESAVSTLQTNLYGVRRTTEAFLPLIPEGGKIVIVSSEVGTWAHQASPPALQQTLEDTEHLTWEALASLAEQYAESRKPEGKGVDLFSNHADPRSGTYYRSYGVSKALVNAYGRLLARQLASDPRRITSVLACPGYCTTDLTHNKGFRTPEQGAKSLLLALEKGVSDSGKLFQDGTDLGIAREVPEAYKMPVPAADAQTTAQ